MFKHLQQQQTSKVFVERITVEFLAMIDLSGNNLVDVCTRIFEHNHKPHLGDRIYKNDSRINDLEKTIRRQIVEHLALQPKCDRELCLALMSLVKDAERLGDYIKNLYEVDHILEGSLDDAHFTDYFGTLTDDVKALFQTTRSALTQDSEQDAQAARQEVLRLKKQCDAIVKRLSSCDLNVNEAVAFTLLARHFKRVVAHLGNILTSITHPLTELDYPTR